MAGQPNGSEPTATRARLERAALDLFAEHGYDEVSVTQIAAAAGVSERTFFRHFGSKLDSLMGSPHDRVSFFVETLRHQPPELSPLEAVLATIAAEDERFPPTPDDLLRRRIINAAPSLADGVRALESVIEATFTDWLAERTGRDPADYEVAMVAAVLVASRRVTLAAWDASDGTESIVDLAARALAVLEVRLDQL
ncbi:MAG: TetR/AcrR family transcriptional regulator [Actinomycetota bacterium]